MTAPLNSNKLRRLIFSLIDMLSAEYLQRFAGLSRIYGMDALDRLQQARFCIIGVGGVGSWAAEAAARSGIGRITLIDHDDIEAGNTNRQLHTLQSTIGRSKVEALAERIQLINPEGKANNRRVEFTILGDD